MYQASLSYIQEFPDHEMDIEQDEWNEANYDRL